MEKEIAKKMIDSVGEFLDMKMKTGAIVNKYEIEGVLNTMYRIANPPQTPPTKP